MRLLNASTLQLEKFDNDSNIPRYAILSHTWGDSEVLFEDLQKYSLKSSAYIRVKSGYYKIAKTCMQAIIDGLDYIWVDTIAIDKSSSSELSEAINSMFMWYKRAAVCYVYLEDVDLFDPMRTGDMSFAQSDERRFWNNSLDLLDESDLAKAKWFTRGWTLQELIAPKKVLFYIKGWKYVGNKTSMTAKLERITGIDELTLSGGDLGSVSVARRMSWASKRETTRTEDIAYCLMGIFDVNMPLLYGEGEKAFVRLQEEIMKDSADQSLFTWMPLDSFRMEELREDGRFLRQSGEPVPVNCFLSTQNVSQSGLSIFASRPSEFGASGSIYSGASLYGGPPYSLTNRGVRMDVRLLSLDQKFHLVILECALADTRQETLGIVVKRYHGFNFPPNNILSQSTEYRQFARVEGVGLVRINIRMCSSVPYMPVYLCKKVPKDLLVVRA